MSLADILGGLGGLGEGYLKGTNQLQQLQSQQYANALRQLQMQQLVQGGGAAWGALQQGVNPMNQPGSPVPMMDQTQAGLSAVQQSPLSQAPPNLPQVPDATAQMGATGGGDLLIPNLANKNVNWQGESPQFKQNVSAMLAAMPPDIRQGANVDSAFRSYDEQVPLYQKYLQGGPLAAPPGKSQHQLGNAADWNTSSPQTLAWMQGNKNENVHRFGLDFPLGAKDPDHMQLLKANAINQQVDQSLPPPVKVAAQGPATTVLRSFGNNPMAQIGQHDPSTIVSAIDKANPGAPDFVKFAAFQQLYPLLTNAGKIDFAQAIQLMRTEQAGERIQNTKDMMDLRRDLGTQPKGPPYQPMDAEGKPVGPPGVMEGNRFIPMQGLPPGAGGGLSRIAAKPVGGGVSDMQAQWVADYIQKVGTWPATTGRNQLLQNKVEQILAERKVDPTTIAVAKGAFKADETSLTQATKLRDAVHSYEGTALRNLDQATIEMERSSPTDFGPWLNHWVMTGEMQMGDEKPPAAIASVLTFSNEYAKVMSGATGAQAATDSSRREAQTILSPYFAKGQWGEASRIARTDMKNRITELDDNVDIIKSRMGRGGQSSRGESSGVSTSRDVPEVNEQQYDSLQSGSFYRMPGDPPGSMRQKP